MTRLLYPAIGLALMAPPAHALEPLAFGPFEATVEGGLNATVVRDQGDTLTSGYLDLYLTFRQPDGDLTFGAELFSELVYDSEAEPELAVLDDPYVDLGLWLEGDRFGYLAYSYTSSAIGEHCIEAPTTGDNYAHGDYVTVGTCPAFDARSVLFYRTPDLGDGLQVAVSYMPETGFESVSAGEAAESVSVALIGMYSFVPDKLIADAGIWQIRTDDAGVVDDRTIIAVAPIDLPLLSGPVSVLVHDGSWRYGWGGRRSGSGWRSRPRDDLRRRRPIAER